jgi:hypothetical protein
LKTVVAMVADYREAEVLIKELLRNGFRREDLGIIGMHAPEGPSETGNELLDLSIEEFFGAEEAPEVRGYYAQNVSRGGRIVSVFVEDELADRAAAAMICHGAVRVYNHSTEMPTFEEFQLSNKVGIEGKAGSPHPFYEAKA